MNNGKVAIVSGAGGGIGREIALTLAKTGASIVINDIGVSVTGEGGSSSPAEETKNLIEKMGGRSVIDTNSVDNWEGASAIVETAISEYGQIDIVINNAGILRDTIFHKMTPEQWLSVIGVHLNGSFFLSRAAAEHFRKQESGAFVHMTSTSGLIGNFGQANYAASKAGQVALVKSLSKEVASRKITVNCVSPGFIDTDFISDLPDEQKNTYKQQIPLKRFGSVQDVVAPVLFLASKESSYITGSVLEVTGGL